jgi:hypothetical protein
LSILPSYKKVQLVLNSESYFNTYVSTAKDKVWNYERDNKTVNYGISSIHEANSNNIENLAEEKDYANYKETLLSAYNKSSNPWNSSSIGGSISYEYK